MPAFSFEIKQEAGQTKLQQLVHSITEAISQGLLKIGDPLPSVNQLSAETGFSRDTVFKAYNILKQQNIIESAPQKGYFIASESYKIFMLLDDFSAFKEQLYQSFRKNLPENFAVDLLFHHYNQEVFEQLIQNSLGRYSVYIIMNINHKNIHPILEKIDSNKLLILDMGNPEKRKMNFLLQDFNQSVKSGLKKGIQQIKNYNELVMIYDEKDTPHPPETVFAVRSFCKSIQIPFQKNHQLIESEIKTGQVYFVIRDSDLVKIVKTCRKKQLGIGKDVGIISYNDSPMKQIVEGGITVITTDFEQMGQLAANFVQDKHPIKKILPTYFILRNSL